MSGPGQHGFFHEIARAVWEDALFGLIGRMRCCPVPVRQALPGAPVLPTVAVRRILHDWHAGHDATRCYRDLTAASS